MVSRPKLRGKLLWWVALALAVSAFLLGMFLLLRDRKGTPGDPAGFYYAIFRDSVKQNRYEIHRATKQGAPVYLVVDLSQTGLTGEEKADILRQLGEDGSGLPVLDLPIGKLDEQCDLEELTDMITAIGLPVDWRWGEIFPISYRLGTQLPPPESFGVEPIRVDYLMWWGGWQGRRDVSYFHYPGGWRIYDRGIETQIS